MTITVPDWLLISETYSFPRKTSRFTWLGGHYEGPVLVDEGVGDNGPQGRVSQPVLQLTSHKVPDTLEENSAIKHYWKIPQLSTIGKFRNKALLENSAIKHYWKIPQLSTIRKLEKHPQTKRKMHFFSVSSDY